MVAELVALKVDVLVTVGTQTGPYARDATTSIPVVFIFVPDPVGSHFVESLARPGRNMTGLSHFGIDIVHKRLQYLKDLVPGLSRVALLVNPNTEVAPLYKRVTETAAAELGLENRTFEARSLDELGRAFDAMVKADMQAVTINGEGLVYQQRANVAKMTLARRLPLAVWSRETFEAGALMSFGADQVAMCRRGPVFVDKILKGAKPGDLPVEQPTTLEFLINRKLAGRSDSRSRPVCSRVPIKWFSDRRPRGLVIDARDQGLEARDWNSHRRVCPPVLAPRAKEPIALAEVPSPPVPSL